MPRVTSTASSGLTNTSMSEAILGPSETPADTHVKAHRTVLITRREQADVVDLGLGAVLHTAGHAHLELPRQVGVLPVPGEVVRDGLGHRVSVYYLLTSQARDGAAQNVAGRVAAGLHGRHAYLFKPAPDLRHVLHLDPVHLDVLASGQIKEVVAEMRVGYWAVREIERYLPDDLRLLRADNTTRYLYADHERVPPLVLWVDADPLEALDLTWNLAHRLDALFGVSV